MSALRRYCCKSLKRRSGQFLAKERNERESPINTASNPLRESPVSLARGDLAPHIIIQSPRIRDREFESHLQKRLLQQNLPLDDIGRLEARQSHRDLGARRPAPLVEPGAVLRRHPRALRLRRMPLTRGCLL